MFLVLGNCLGLFGFRPLTADVNMTFALSTITFFLIQFNSFRSMGVKGKLLHMCEPFPWYVGAFTMFPLKIIEAVSQPVSLGFRLFGNILAGVIVMGLLFSGLTFISNIFVDFPIFVAIVPLPAAAFFDIFHPIVQAYIFTMLTMVFISMEIIRQGDGESH
jgi:F-type H+-transporting ATPase subunit a